MSGPRPVLRYQDRSGRGPFQPGLTVRWADRDGKSPPTAFEDFPQLVGMLPKLHEKWMHVGFACIGLDGIAAYFTETERAKLDALGFRLHRAPASAVILQAPTQVVFAHHRPLKTLPRYPNTRRIGGKLLETQT